jgi:hypothetical protein
MWRVRPRAPTGTRAERSASHAKVGPRGGWQKVVRYRNFGTNQNHDSEVSGNAWCSQSARRATHAAAPAVPSSRVFAPTRRDACEARRRRPQAARRHVPFLARGHRRCRRREASKADAVRRPAPRVGLHQRGRGEIQAHGRAGQGTSRARLQKSRRAALAIPGRPRVAHAANTAARARPIFEFLCRKGTPPATKNTRIFPPSPRLTAARLPPVTPSPGATRPAHVQASRGREGCARGPQRGENLGAAGKERNAPRRGQDGL